MADIELATASWSGFYDNDPWLNQENWQRYFANTVVDGTPSSDIYNGNWRGNLAPYLDNNGNLIIDSGICFAKGIAARFASSTNVGNSTEDTIFVSVIVDPETRTAKMMSYNVGSSAVTQLLTNPRYFCQSDYEIPICYRDAGRVIDLRHFATDRNSRSNAGLESIIFQASASPAVTQYPFGKAYGFEGNRNAFIRAYLGRTYTVTMESGASIDTLRIMPIPVCSSEPVTFTVYNNTANAVIIVLSTDNGYYRNEYVWSTSWTAEINLDVKKTLASNSSMTFVLTPAGLDEHKVLYAISSPSTSEGGAIDPETIYTKSEVNSLLEGKADDTDVVSLQNAVEGKAEAVDLAHVWESGEVYQTGDLVTHNSRLYRFLRDFTGFEWDSTAVESVTVAEQIAVKADADAVYTKTEANALLADKADADAVYTKTEANALLADKADADSVYTKTEANALLAEKADSDTVYTKSESDALLAEKADAADVYTKEEVDSLIPEQTWYTKDEADALLTEKADAADVYTKEESDDRYAGDVAMRSALSEKANANDVYNKTQMDSFLSQKANAADVYTKTEVYNKTEIDAALALQPSDKLYVDNVRGSNNNDGLTVNTAFKTIQKAIDMVPVSYPTTIMLVPGEYQESIIIDNNKVIYFQGTSNTEIKFKPANGSPITVKQNSYLEISGKYFIDMLNQITSPSNGYAIKVLDNSTFSYKGISDNDTLTIDNNRYYGNIYLSGSIFKSDAKIIIYNKSSQTASAFESRNSICNISALDYLDCDKFDHVVEAYSSLITINTLNSDASKYLGRTSVVLVAKENDSDEFDYYTKSEIDKLIGKDADAAFYVDYLSGSDDNDGFSRETAFKTYKKAISACPENFASKIYVVAYPAGTRDSEFKIDVSEKKITFKGYMNDKIYTSGIYAHNNAYLRFESEVKVEGTGDCVLAERNSYIDFVPTGYLLPDVKINIVGIATQYDAGYPYSYNKRIIAATYGSTIIIPGTVEAGVVVSGSGSSYQEGHATNNAVDADTGSNIYIGNLNIKGYSDHTIFESNGSTIMYGSLTKSGGTTKTVSNGGVVRTGSAG